MAGEFVGMEVAVIVVTASIVLSGILVGLGRAFGYKAIEHFGMDELMQSIVNSVIIGSFAAVIELVKAISSTVVSKTCATGTVIEQLACTLDGLNIVLFSLFQNLVQVLNLVGYYQTISLDFGSFSIAPLINLSSVSAALSLQLLSVNVIMILVELNRNIAGFIGMNALGLIFPIGLVLRTFFATRKVGGFLLALAVGLYIFYPTFVLIFPEPMADVQNTTILMQNFTNNSYYATVPVVDLNGNNAIALKLDVLSGRCNQGMVNNLTYAYNATNDTNSTNMTLNLTSCQVSMLQMQNLSLNLTNGSTTSLFANDFTGDLTMIVQGLKVALSKSLLYAVVAPLFSLIITIVFVRELASLLGSEIGMRTIASI
jgi:hypothetical protein